MRKLLWLKKLNFSFVWLIYIGFHLNITEHYPEVFLKWQKYLPVSRNLALNRDLDINVEHVGVMHDVKFPKIDITDFKATFLIVTYAVIFTKMLLLEPILFWLHVHPPFLYLQQMIVLLSKLGRN